MKRIAIWSILASVTFVGVLRAFEVEATIRKIDLDKGSVVFFAKGMNRTGSLAKDVKVVDAAGKEIADGLKAVKEGAQVVLAVENEGGKPVIHSIRLGKAAAPPEPRKETKQQDTSKLKPLTDLGKYSYQGFQGGLYPEGKNERPAAHEAFGRLLAKKIQPLNRDGKPDKNGKIVLLGVGFSNTVQAFTGFMQVATEDKEIDPAIVLVNGAVGGMPASVIQNPGDNGKGAKYWALVDDKLKAAGVTRAQVQAIWLKETNPAPHEGGFPQYTRALHGELANIVRLFPERFPNAKMVYLSSRTFGGWARGKGDRGPGNAEPFSYETGFAVQWLIADQLKGDAGLNCDPAKGIVKAPWLSWGPYLWANGQAKRGDGFHFEIEDYRDDDRMHHSPAGMQKMGQQLLHFFKNDSTTREWFTRSRTGAKIKPMEIYFVDVGRTVGNATIVVAPSGESMVLDAGPGPMAPRVFEVLRKAGVAKVDYLVTTHYNADHCGATAELAKLIPIIHFVDHGESVEAGKSDAWWKERRGPWFKPGMGERYDALYQSYVKARQGSRHSVVRPGDTVPIKGIEVRVLCAGGKVLREPLAGAGELNPACADVDKRGDDDAEDAQSIGVLVRSGSFRFVYLGDLTWNKANELFCPKNLVGRVDAYLVTHHAQSLPKSLGHYYYGLSACPKSEVHGLNPRVAILSLGALGHRQGTPEAIDNVRKAPGLEDLWQTQFIEAGGEKDHNSPKDFIANIGGKNDEARYLKLTANPDGSFTMFNSRNGFTKPYGVR